VLPDDDKKVKMWYGGPIGFVLYLKPQQFQTILIVNYTHTHTHTHTQTYSHTHTYICMYVHIALLYASIKL